MAEKEIKFEEVTSHLITSGFVYPGSDIYGGLSNSWDYGPLGTLLKNHVKDLWLRHFVRTEFPQQLRCGRRKRTILYQSCMVIA